MSMTCLAIYARPYLAVVARPSAAALVQRAAALDAAHEAPRQGDRGLQARHLVGRQAAVARGAPRRGAAQNNQSTDVKWMKTTIGLFGCLRIHPECKSCSNLGSSSNLGSGRCSEGPPCLGGTAGESPSPPAAALLSSQSCRQVLQKTCEHEV